MFSLFPDNVNLQGHYSAKDKENFINMYLLHSKIVQALKTESNTLLLIYSFLLIMPKRRKEKCRSHEWNSLIISYSLYK